MKVECSAAPLSEANDKELFMLDKINICSVLVVEWIKTERT